MKYFEIYEPYYAMIKAINEDSALELYGDVVCDLEPDMEVEEISRDQALIRYSRALSEDNEPAKEKEVIEDFNRVLAEVLLVPRELL